MSYVVFAGSPMKLTNHRPNAVTHNRAKYCRGTRLQDQKGRGCAEKKVNKSEPHLSAKQADTN